MPISSPAPNYPELRGKKELTNTTGLEDEIITTLNSGDVVFNDLLIVIWSCAQNSGGERILPIAVDEQGNEIAYFDDLWQSDNNYGRELFIFSGVVTRSPLTTAGAVNGKVTVNIPTNAISTRRLIVQSVYPGAGGRIWGTTGYLAENGVKAPARAQRYAILDDDPAVRGTTNPWKIIYQDNEYGTFTSFDNLGNPVYSVSSEPEYVIAAFNTGSTANIQIDVDGPAGASFSNSRTFPAGTGSTLFGYFSVSASAAQVSAASACSYSTGVASRKEALSIVYAPERVQARANVVSVAASGNYHVTRRSSARSNVVGRGAGFGYIHNAATNVIPENDDPFRYRTREGRSNLTVDGLTPQPPYRKGGVGNNSSDFWGWAIHQLEPPAAANSVVYTTGVQPANWTQLADLPSGGLSSQSGFWGLDATPAFAPIGSKLYLTGGYSFADGATQNETYEYDISTNIWTLVQDASGNPVLCPGVHRQTNGFAINGKFALFSRTDASSISSLDLYDPATKTWSSEAGPPSSGYGYEKVAANATCAYGTKMYSFGGYEGSSGDLRSKGAIWDSAAASGSRWSSTSDWNATFATIPALVNQGVAVSGNKAFLFGGSKYPSGDTDYTLIYDFTANTWASGASMPASGSEIVCGKAFGRFILVHVGKNTYGYNPSTNTWTGILAKSVTSEIKGAGYCVGIDAYLYALGGTGSLPPSTSQYSGRRVLQRFAPIVTRSISPSGTSSMTITATGITVASAAISGTSNFDASGRVVHDNGPYVGQIIII